MNLYEFFVLSLLRTILYYLVYQKTDINDVVKRKAQHLLNDAGSYLILHNKSPEEIND